MSDRVTLRAKRKMVEDGSHKHYTVMIQVFERVNQRPEVDSTQFIAAESISQAIRKAGMRLVQKIKKEDNGTSNDD